MRAHAPTGRRVALLAASCLLAGWSIRASGTPAGATPELDHACVVRLAETAAGSMTIAEMRDRCRLGPVPAVDATAGDPSPAGEPPPPEEEEPPVSPVEKRLADEREAAARPFSIMAHRPNYFLAAAWNAEGWMSVGDSPDSAAPADEYRDVESQFQLSLKVPLAIGLFGDRVDLYGAYTGRSFWQV